MIEQSRIKLYTITELCSQGKNYYGHKFVEYRNSSLEPKIYYQCIAYITPGACMWIERLDGEISR